MVYSVENENSISWFSAIFFIRAFDRITWILRHEQSSLNTNQTNTMVTLANIIVIIVCTKHNNNPDTIGMTSEKIGWKDKWKSRKIATGRKIIWTWRLREWNWSARISHFRKKKNKKTLKTRTWSSFFARIAWNAYGIASLFVKCLVTHINV